METKKIEVTIVGAGNLGHAMAGFMGAKDEIIVNLYTRKADELSASVKEGITVNHEGGTTVGIVNKVSSDPKEVFPNADLVYITAPSHARPSILQQIRDHLKPGVMIGAVPGVGCFDLMCRNALGERIEKGEVIVFGLRAVPYTATRWVAGKSVDVLKKKKQMDYAVIVENEEETERVGEAISSTLDMKTVPLSHFLSVTLTPSNPIIHPSIMYGMFGPHSGWDGKPVPEKPLFYEDCSKRSAMYLTQTDNELQAIKDKIEDKTGIDLSDVLPIKDHMQRNYGKDAVDNSSVLSALRTNLAYKSIRTPLKEVEGGFVPDFDHRFFNEDIPWGMIILRSIADMVGVEVPTVDEIIMWAQSNMGKEYLKDGKLIGKDLGETGDVRRFGCSNIRELAGSLQKIGER